jgi:hypothetical protein
MNQASNKIKTAVLKGLVNLSADTIKITLMQSGFVYNKASHGVLADVSAYQLATIGTSYTVGGSAVTSKTVAQDDLLSCGKVTLAHPGWTAATGETIGPASGAIIYDDTCATTDYVDVIIAYIDFGGDKSVLAGGLFKITDPVVKFS